MRTRISKTDKRPARVLITMIAVIVLLEFLHIWLTVSYVEKGIELGKTQEQIQQLDNENMILKAKLLQAKSLTTIHDKAISQGYVPAVYFYVKEVKR